MSAICERLIFIANLFDVGVFLFVPFPSGLKGHPGSIQGFATILVVFPVSQLFATGANWCGKPDLAAVSLTSTAHTSLTSQHVRALMTSNHTLINVAPRATSRAIFSQRRIKPCGQRLKEKTTMITGDSKAVETAERVLGNVQLNSERNGPGSRFVCVFLARLACGSRHYESETRGNDRRLGSRHGRVGRGPHDRVRHGDCRRRHQQQPEPSAEPRAQVRVREHELLGQHCAAVCDELLGDEQAECRRVHWRRLQQSVRVREPSRRQVEPARHLLGLHVRPPLQPEHFPHFCPHGW